MLDVFGDSFYISEDICEEHVFPGAPKDLDFLVYCDVLILCFML